MGDRAESFTHEPKCHSAPYAAAPILSYKNIGKLPQNHHELPSALVVFSSPSHTMPGVLEVTLQELSPLLVCHDHHMVFSLAIDS